MKLLVGFKARDYSQELTSTCLSFQVALEHSDYYIIFLLPFPHAHYITVERHL